jgi:phage replication-related protein YjqB (UPF0714/DUF867 family)
MTDYSMNMLAAHERKRVSIVNAIAGRSSVAVVAPRAGRIAPLTGELARAVAGRSHRLYCRVVDVAAPSAERGRRGPAQAQGHEAIPLDEPILRTVLAGTRTVVAIAGSPSDEDAMTVIRGSDRALVLRLWTALTEVGFAAMMAPACEADADPAQLFNRASEGGVELVLTRRLRKDLERGFVRRPLFDCYVGAVQRALAAEMARREPMTGWSRAGVDVAAAPVLSPAA